MENTVWYLDPRFLGPAVAAVLSLLLGIINLSKQVKKDASAIEAQKTDSDVKVGTLALEMTKELREQLAEERDKRRAVEDALATEQSLVAECERKLADLTEAFIDLRDCYMILMTQMAENGMKPKCTPNKAMELKL